MKKSRLSRREFLRMSLVGITASTIASCTPATSTTPAQPSTPGKSSGQELTATPAGSSLPSSTPEESTLSIVYPQNNTKVSNSNVIFSWKGIPNVEGYIIEVFSFGRRFADEKYGWVFKYSDFTVNNFYNPAEKNYKLDLNSPYYWSVTAVQKKISPPSKDVYQLPGGMSLALDNDTDQATVYDNNSNMALPQRDPLSGQVGFVDGKFFTKPTSNYLNTYLKMLEAEQISKKAGIVTPIIPLLFYLLERLDKANSNPQVALPPEFDKFSNKVKALLDEDPFKSSNKLSKVLGLYHSADNVTKANLFGAEYTVFPNDEDGDKWIKDIINKLFEQSWIKQLNQIPEDKIIDIDFKGLFNYKNPLNLPINLKVEDDGENFLNKNSLLNKDEKFSLWIIADNGEKKTLDNLSLVQDNETYFIRADSIAFGDLDSSTYTIKLISASQPTLDIPNGYAAVSGGKPFVLAVTPNLVKENGPVIQVEVKVKDGGTGNSIILKKDAETYQIICRQSSQTLTYQTYTFTIDDSNPRPPSGIYQLSYQERDYINPNGPLINSVNTLEFKIEGAQYEARVKKITCKDESNPEWWGDDSISYMALVNTNNFIQYPRVSKPYGGFSDGKLLTDNDHNFSTDPAHIIYDKRIIEGSITIALSLYEHDNLDWLAWCFNKIIDVVQSFLEGIINIFTYGVGGYIIEAGLEISGVNDMREQAINSMVAGWEIELLSRGFYSLPDPQGQTFMNESIDLKGSDNHYVVSFELATI